MSWQVNLQKRIYLTSKTHAYRYLYRKGLEANKPNASKWDQFSMPNWLEWKRQVEGPVSVLYNWLYFLETFTAAGELYTSVSLKKKKKFQRGCTCYLFLMNQWRQDGSPHLYYYCSFHDLCFNCRYRPGNLIFSWRSLQLKCAFGLFTLF